MPNGKGLALSSSKGSVGVIALVVLILVIAAGSMIYFESNKTKTPVTASPTPSQSAEATPSPTPSVSATPSPQPVVDTSNWKTYHSPYLKLSFSYPDTPKFAITAVRRSLHAYGYATTTYPAISLAHTVPVPAQCLSGSESCPDITNNPEIFFIILNKPYAEVIASSSLSSFKDIFEEKTVGEYTGTYMEMGSEGDGSYTFFFPIGATKTMYMSGNFVMEEIFLDTYTGVKDWIPYAQQKLIFEAVIRSLQFDK